MLRLRASSTSSSDDARDLERTRGALRGRARIVPAVVSFLLTVALLVGSIWHHRDSLQRDIKQHGVTEGPLLDVLARWRAARSGGGPGAVLFGNSLVDCKDGLSVGTLVTQRLATAGIPHDLVQAVSGAFGPLQYYYLLDEVLAGSPRLAIVEVDLGRVSAGSVAPSLRYASLSRKLSLRRAWRVRGALAFEGLTLLDPSLYALEERLDAMYLVPGTQAAWQALVDAGGRAVTSRLGLPTASPDGRGPRMLAKFDAAGARALFRAPQSAHPLTGVLRELAAALRATGARLLFYVPPINPNVLREASPDERRAFAERIDAVRVAIGLAPEEWLDLHGIVLEDAFRDMVGHMRPAGCRAVAERIGDALDGARGHAPAPHST